MILKCHCKFTHRLCLGFSRCIWLLDLIKCHAYLFCRSVVFTVFLERESGCEFRWRGGQTTSAAAANPAAADADQLAASLTWSWHQIWVLGKTFTPHWFVLDVWVWWQNICVYICRPYKQNRPSQDCVFGSAPRYCISDKIWFSEAPCTEGAVGWTPARLTRCRRPREDKVPLKDRVLHLPLELTNHLGEICNQDLRLLLKIFLQLKPRLVQSQRVWHDLSRPTSSLELSHSSTLPNIRMAMSLVLQAYLSRGIRWKLVIFPV